MSQELIVCVCVCVIHKVEYNTVVLHPVPLFSLGLRVFKTNLGVFCVFVMR